MSGTLDKGKALRRDTKKRKNGGPRHLFTFECSKEGCSIQFTVRSDYMEHHSSLCTKHSHVKRPFESIYLGIHRDWRDVKVDLTYEEFLDFTSTEHLRRDEGGHESRTRSSSIKQKTLLIGGGLFFLRLS